VELVKLSDLMRINGVRPIFARILYEIRVFTTEKVALSGTKELRAKIIAVNEARLFPKANLGFRDVDHCIWFARMLPMATEC
jgi:hypothetical protein